MSTEDRKTPSGYEFDILKKYREIEGIVVYDQVPPESLRGLVYKPWKSNNGFAYGEANNTEFLAGLDRIGNTPIERLEKILREPQLVRDGPLGSWRIPEYWDGQEVIYLGKDESLPQLLAGDNNTVTQDLHTTHQELGTFLLYPGKLLETITQTAIKKARQEYYSKNPGYRGLEGPESPNIPGIEQQDLDRVNTFHYVLENVVYRYNNKPGDKATERNPLIKIEDGNSLNTITRLSDNWQLVFYDTVARMAQLAGFYGGKKSRYRIEPKKIAKLAGLASPNKK